jgi:hypothetical protein
MTQRANLSASLRNKPTFDLESLKACMKLLTAEASNLEAFALRHFHISFQDKIRYKQAIKTLSLNMIGITGEVFGQTKIEEVKEEKPGVAAGPSYQKYINAFNNLSAMITLEVTMLSNPDHALFAVERWIKIASLCGRSRAHFAVAVIVSGIAAVPNALLDSLPIRVKRRYMDLQHIFTRPQEITKKQNLELMLHLATIPLMSAFLNMVLIKKAQEENKSAEVKKSEKSHYRKPTRQMLETFFKEDVKTLNTFLDLYGLNRLEEKSTLTPTETPAPPPVDVKRMQIDSLKESLRIISSGKGPFTQPDKQPVRALEACSVEQIEKEMKDLQKKLRYAINALVKQLSPVFMLIGDTDIKAVVLQQDREMKERMMNESATPDSLAALQVNPKPTLTKSKSYVWVAPQTEYFERIGLGLLNLGIMPLSRVRMHATMFALPLEHRKDALAAQEIESPSSFLTLK